MVILGLRQVVESVLLRHALNVEMGGKEEVIALMRNFL